MSAKPSEVQFPGGLSDKVRGIYPGLSDDEVDDLLWNATGFPLARPDEVLRQLQEHKDAGCLTPADACARADTMLREAEARLGAKAPGTKKHPARKVA